MSWLEETILKHNVYTMGKSDKDIFVTVAHKDLASAIRDELKKRMPVKMDEHCEGCSALYYANKSKGEKMCDCGMIDRNDALAEVSKALGLEVQE
jgi:hypothetical protein